jgi:type I restriction-modification system DNA methylase subunit
MGELGQVFTPINIAQLMSELLIEGTPKLQPAKVLDPCIGQNVFLANLCEIAPELTVEGVELDAGLIQQKTQAFYAHPGRKLHLGNFFDYAQSHKPDLDFIITNPPYVRHEKMTDENDKQAIQGLFRDKDYKVPGKSNLYVYFLLKSIDLLKPGGKLVAIVYDSWLYSSYGESLKTTLSSLGSIESIIHFQRKAFTNVHVGTTIIEFKKGIEQSRQVRFATHSDASSVNQLSDIKWKLIDSTELAQSSQRPVSTHRKLISLEKLAEINRGTSALSNKLFVFKDKEFKETIPFLKNIKDIDGMAATGDKHLLVVRNSYAKETSSYLEKIREHILSNDKEFYTLSKRIQSKAVWYSPRLAKTGDIIFNYYLRDSLDFILNAKRLQSSDNFYNLRFGTDLYVHFAMLNSSYVKSSVLRNSRLQGGGLRKIQLYEFKKVLVPNLSTFSKSSMVDLKRLGKRLAKQDRTSNKKQETIAEIDKIIDAELNYRKEKQKVVYSNKDYGAALV